MNSGSPLDRSTIFLSGFAPKRLNTTEPAWVSFRTAITSIAVCAEVTAACELLGLDPLHVVNEGRFIAFVAPEDAGRAVALLRRHAVTSAASMIGTVVGGPAGQVSCRGPFGVQRIVPT
jgi:hydrogenase expression/formation protein HypE